MKINGSRHYAYNDHDHKAYQQIGMPPVFDLAVPGTLNHDDAVLSDYEMNEGTHDRFDGVGIFAVEEIKIESRQSDQCYRCGAKHNGLQILLS